MDWINKNTWIHSCKSYEIKVNKNNNVKYLTAYLYNIKGNLVKDKIILHPKLKNYCLENINGHFKYTITKEQEKLINLIHPSCRFQKVNL